MSISPPLNPGYSNSWLTCQRIGEYFQSDSPWNRRLWAVSLISTLELVLESSKAWEAGVLSDAAFDDLRNRAMIAAGKDHGTGDKSQKQLLHEVFKHPFGPGDAGFHTARLITDDISQNYLDRWKNVSTNTAVPIEHTARCVASYMLDMGFSSDFLTAWHKTSITGGASATCLADFIGQAATLAAQPLINAEVAIAFKRAPRSNSTQAANWRDGSAFVKWLGTHGFDSGGYRIAGGLVFTLTGRDLVSITIQAQELFQSVMSRLHLGSKIVHEAHPILWVEGRQRPAPLDRHSRGVELHALHRADELYESVHDRQVENAIHLLGILDSGPAGAAVAAGWAALESLLTGPADTGSRAIGADRAAAIIACSFPRAELTRLAYAHIATDRSTFASTLEAAGTNKEKCRLLEEHLRLGRRLACTWEPDIAAESRMNAMISDPSSVLNAVCKHVTTAFRRMYLVRNLVVHHGAIDSVGLQPALRVAAPLIGAVMDRVLHASTHEKIQPMRLSSRAEMAIANMKSQHPRELTLLLEP